MFCSFNILKQTRRFEYVYRYHQANGAEPSTAFLQNRHSQSVPVLHKLQYDRSDTAPYCITQ